MNTHNNQPNWDHIAEKFDLWLPQLAPVADTLISALDVQAGEQVIDIASGTGEPALTLAQQQPQAQIMGNDAAQAMVKVAQKKARQHGLSNINFKTMPAEALIYEENTFDKALCRFGIMLFDDPLQGLKEISRVLKPGGQFAFAVWSSEETMTTLRWASAAFKNRIAVEHQPPSTKISSMGTPGTIEPLLDQARLNKYTIETKQFNYRFDNFDEYWRLIKTSDIMKQQFDALPQNQHTDVRNQIADFAAVFQTERGLVIPHEYRLITGEKI